MLNNQLLDVALTVRENACAPYRRFAVGAVLLTESGEIFTGCNIENVSPGLTICAEGAAGVGAVSKCLSELFPLPKRDIMEPRENV
jgi:cytidine deaminase